MTEPRKTPNPLQLLDQLVEQIGAYGVDVDRSPIGELAPNTALIDAIKAVRAGIGELQETIDLAWGVVANAGDGDWYRESEQWREAAARWRDERFIPRVAPESTALSRGLARIEALTALLVHETREAAGELERAAGISGHQLHMQATAAGPNPDYRPELELERAPKGDVGAELDGGPANG